MEEGYSDPDDVVANVAAMHYATYLDRHYLPRVVALYRSLERHSPPFVLWVLCLDAEVQRTLTLMGLKHARLVPLGDLEQADAALLTVKADRLPVEYYWTCGPAFLLYVFGHSADVQMLTYLDADLFFFSDPTPLYEELGTNSILIVESRRTPSNHDIDKHLGRFNVGLLVFRRTSIGLACLRRWREQCLEWCFDRFEQGRFGDQAYLDDWPDQFEGVTVLQHRGAGLGPSNVLRLSVVRAQGRLFVGTAPLVFYHFSALRRISHWRYEMHHWRFHRQAASRVVRRDIYGSYIHELQVAEHTIRGVDAQVHTHTVGRSAATAMSLRRRMADNDWRSTLVRYRRYILVIGPFVC